MLPRQKWIQLKKPKDQAEAEKIADADFNTLVERFKQVLGESVADVRASNRLSQSVARLADAGWHAQPGVAARL